MLLKLFGVIFLLVRLEPSDGSRSFSYTDVQVLIAFKDVINDRNSKLTSWKATQVDACDWEGITCLKGSDRVSEVALDGFSLSGQINGNIFQLEHLRKLSLSRNNFTGILNPDIISSLGILEAIDLGENNISGSIPEFFQYCGSLKLINLSNNGFYGAVPRSLGTCSTLETLNLSSNRLSVGFSGDLWSLDALKVLDLSDNLLSGEIPSGIEQFEKLEHLDLSRNHFSGSIPESMGRLLSLKLVNLSMNELNGNLPVALSGCKNLSKVDFSKNSLTGELPSWIFQNDLQAVSLSGNRFHGPVQILSASTMGTLRLQVLDLSRNKFSGTISQSIGSFPHLQVLKLSSNHFLGEIPISVMQLNKLEILDLSKNLLNGSIPSQVGEAVALRELRLGNNFLTGVVPDEIGNCSSLAILILSSNLLQGELPDTIAKLQNLQILDVSVNNLTGSLPKNLYNLRSLTTFNISYNNFQGILPACNFVNKIPISFSGNRFLHCSVNCSCTKVSNKPIVLNPNSSSNASNSAPFSSKNSQKKIGLKISALIAIGAAAFIALGVITITALNLHVRSATSHSAALALFNGDEDFSHSPVTDASSGKLVMFTGNPDFSTSTHALLNKDCELGHGGFGAVYRVALRDGSPVAIKKLTVSSLVKSQDDFEREVKKLGKISHPNLVVLHGYYWNPSLQLLIYEYIPGGTLYKHLHDSSAENAFSWQERFNVVLGTAKGLAHLHQLNIIHYNMKSSNILLGSSGEAKVADFGLVRLLPMLDRYVLSSKIQSALGYMAPEFACRTVKITEKCDVYGFGVLVLEIVTGRRPVEYMEDDVVVLCDMVRGALQEGTVESCMDERLQGKFPAEEAIPLMKLGLICTSQVPSNRPDMGEVVNILELIRCPTEDQELS